ncbi:glycosyl transferase family protein [Salinisphaera sp. PC39]
MLTPVFRYLARHFGAPADFAARGPWSLPILEPHPDVGEICQLHSKRVPFLFNRDQQAMVRWLAVRRQRLLLNLEGDAKTAELLRRAGVASGRVLGFQDMPVDPAYRHQVRAMLSRVRMRLEGRGDIEDLDERLHVPVAPAWREDRDAWLAGRGWSDDELVIVAPGNKRTMSRRSYERGSNRKHWPIEDWARLCDRLLETRPGARILVVGAPVEQRLAAAIAASAASPRVHAVASEMTVTRLLALLAHARGAVALDSGPSHAAAAVGCPVVTLFKATDPSRFGPLSASGLAREVTPGGVPLADWRPGPIALDSVLAAWCSLQDEVAARAGG